MNNLKMIRTKLSLLIQDKALCENCGEGECEVALVSLDMAVCKKCAKDNWLSNSF